jgi:hypothetical protein
LEQKPQEVKQETKQGHEVQGGVVFAKPRQKPPAPAPNPVQALFQNKLLMMILAGLVVVALVVFGLSKILGSKKDKKKQQAVAASESKPAQTAEKEEKPVEAKDVAKEGAAGAQESAELKLAQEAAEAGAAEAVEQVAYKPPPKKQQPKKVKDTPGLMKILDEALVKGDESKLSYAVMGIEKNGDDVVDYLKEYIITNYNKPANRMNAILALFYSSQGDAIAVVKTVLKVDSDEEVRLTALAVLDSLSGQEEIDFIKDISKQDQSERVRKKALEYIEIRSISQ